MRNYLLAFLCVTILLTFLFSCAATVYVPDPPPAPKDEIKPPAPGPKAVWVEGNWKWSGGHYVWVPGHWVKNPKGNWVEGHWDKRPHGWVWVKGQWRP